MTAVYLGVPLYRLFFPSLFHLFCFGECSEPNFAGEIYECLLSLKRGWCLWSDPCLYWLLALNADEPDFLGEDLWFFVLRWLKQKTESWDDCNGNQAFHINQKENAGVSGS